MISQIGSIQDGEYRLRGQLITGLMQKGDWTGTMLLALLGRDPNAEERTILQACLIASIDHGTAPPSAHVTRVIASCGKPLADSVAGGLLTLGPRHGNAGGAAALWLREQVEQSHTPETSVRGALEKKQRLSGFGHAEYERDPRAQMLGTLVRTTLEKHPHTDFAEQVGETLTAVKGKALYLNIDGAIAAAILDLDLPEGLVDALFLIARTVGLAVHALEEFSTAKTYRRF